MPNEEKVLLNATLCFPVAGDKVLMARKKGKIGKDCWNGYGGGIEKGEIPIQTAPRELFEESKLIARSEDMMKVAIIDFHNEKTDGEKFICRVHIYFLRQWTGDVCSTEEMVDPTWFYRDNLPFEEMMPADKEWLPIVLSGKKIMAKAYLGPFQKTLLAKMEIMEVDSFPEE
ncbi:MAG: NUDIX domain-containing protein [Candidatus Colwellbacteria bacterium]|nr:NUDIX domain-containing protein [Candidatus Colwellbacteria bacterium]